MNPLPSTPLPSPGAGRSCIVETAAATGRGSNRNIVSHITGMADGRDYCCNEKSIGNRKTMTVLMVLLTECIIKSHEMKYFFPTCVVQIRCHAFRFATTCIIASKLQEDKYPT